MEKMTENTNPPSDQYLPDEVVAAEIFPRLPLESLVECKYVSKSWKRLVHTIIPMFGLIAANRHTNATINFYQFPMKEYNHYDIEILCRKTNEDDEAAGNECFQVLKHLSVSLLSQNLSSCNGLLLFSSIDHRADKRYYVCNPVLDQWVVLPQLALPQFLGRSDLEVGLAFDGIEGHHFKVVTFSLRTCNLKSETIDCKIFSSETGEWRLHQAAILYSSSLLRTGQFKSFKIAVSRGIYCNGAIYWKIEDTLSCNEERYICRRLYMLVFSLEKEMFKLIQLPIRDEFSTKNSSLLESEGRLYCCANVTVYANISRRANISRHAYYREVIDNSRVSINVWTYTGGQDDEEEEEARTQNEDKYWVLKHSVDCRKLMTQFHDVTLNRYVDDEIIDFTSFVARTFSYDLKVLYLQNEKARDIFLSYDIETERLKLVNDGIKDTQGQNVYASYIFNLVDVPTWDGCKVLKPKLSTGESHCLRLHHIDAATEIRSRLRENITYWLYKEDNTCQFCSKLFADTWK